MRRRDLLKGLFALPVGTSSFSQARRSLGVTPINQFELVLDGPFALVFQQNRPDRLSVFSPTEPNDLHAFFIEGQAGDSKKKHIISLNSGKGTLTASTRPPTLDPCLNPFSWHSDWNSGATDNLVELDLPVPNRISCDADTITPGQFEDGTLVSIPQGHILQYDIHNTNLSVRDSELGNFKPAPSPNPNAIRVTIEIGLWLAGGNDPDSRGLHAVGFHNDRLLPRFSKIKNDRDKRLAAVGALFQIMQSKPHRRRQYTTTVECKTSGFLVTSP